MVGGQLFMEADDAVEALDRGVESADEGEALELLWRASTAVSRAWDEAARSGALRTMGTDEDSRIRRWLERLLGAARRFAERFEAQGFSVSVGWPAGASVSIDWSTDGH